MKLRRTFTLALVLAAGGSALAACGGTAKVGDDRSPVGSAGAGDDSVIDPEGQGGSASDPGHVGPSLGGTVTHYGGTPGAAGDGSDHGGTPGAAGDGSDHGGTPGAAGDGSDHGGTPGAAGDGSDHGGTPGAAGDGSGPGGSPGGGIECGVNTCAAGEYCCNPSCSMCAPMGAACIQIACEDPVPCGQSACHGGQECCNPSCGICTNPGEGCTKQLCVPDPAGCTGDADCRLVDDYCEGCNCLALGAGESPPKCTGNQVACFAEPCMNQYAACIDGACVAAHH